MCYRLIWLTVVDCELDCQKWSVCILLFLQRRATRQICSITSWIRINTSDDPGTQGQLHVGNRCGIGWTITAVAQGLLVSCMIIFVMTYVVSLAVVMLLFIAFVIMNDMMPDRKIAKMADSVNTALRISKWCLIISNRSNGLITTREVKANVSLKIYLLCGWCSATSCYLLIYIRSRLDCMIPVYNFDEMFSLSLEIQDSSINAIVSKNPHKNKAVWQITYLILTGWELEQIEVRLLHREGRPLPVFSTWSLRLLDLGRAIGTQRRTTTITKRDDGSWRRQTDKDTIKTGICKKGQRDWSRV